MISRKIRLFAAASGALGRTARDGLSPQDQEAADVFVVHSFVVAQPKQSRFLCPALGTEGWSAPVFPSTRKGVPAGIKRVLLVIHHPREGWILTSPLWERHRVIHSRMTNWDGLKHDTPFTVERQELNSPDLLGGTMLFPALRERLRPQPSP